MSWYRTGTVAVTNGSKTVTGVGTLWTTAVNAGDAFALVDANLNPTDAWYEVESVTNNTTLVLKQSYAGSTGSNKQYCVFNLVGNMTTPSFAQRLATFFASFQSLIDKPTTTPTASSIPIADANGDIDSGWIKDASATVKGAVELATAAEATAGNDTTRAITPSVSGSRITFATTSTDDATSATAAPLKTAGGLAVAKNAIIGTTLAHAGQHANATRIHYVSPSSSTNWSDFNSVGKGVRFNLPHRVDGIYDITFNAQLSPTGWVFKRATILVQASGSTGVISQKQQIVHAEINGDKIAFDIVEKSSALDGAWLTILASGTGIGAWPSYEVAARMYARSTPAVLSVENVTP